MDIPAVLEGINDGQYQSMYWGPKSGSRNTYEELSEKWPVSNPPLPTKEEMEIYWLTISVV